jgi:hypothetical protein
MNKSRTKLTVELLVAGIVALGGSTLRGADHPFNTELQNHYCKVYNQTGANGEVYDPGCTSVVEVKDAQGLVTGHACPGLDCEWYTAATRCGECKDGYSTCHTDTQPASGQYPTVSVTSKPGAACASYTAEAESAKHGYPNGCGPSTSTCALIGKACACPTQYPGTTSSRNVTCECG